MEKDAKQKVIDYLVGHLYLTLATVSRDGSPLSHTVGYFIDNTVGFGHRDHVDF